MRAPTDVLITYLAIFHRLFQTMEEAAFANDLERMWLCQWGADALHNVPSMLRDYRGKQSWNRLDEIESWTRSFPDYLRSQGVPNSVAEQAERMFARNGAKKELGLTEDLKNVSLIPDDEMNAHLDLLYGVCLDCRQRRIWSGMEEEDWQDCVRLGRRNGAIAAIARELTWGMVHWRDFDSDSVRQRLAEARAY
jgi:hypothetical protein